VDSSDILKKVQDIEYEALVEFDKICRANDIKYFLRGGSVLGAVKYSGFVPWDDDIDIALPRTDYIRLIETIPVYFGEKFYFVAYQKTENAHCYFPRILLREEYRIKYGLPKNNERGLVLIDVLPLDGMPSGKIGLKMHIIKAYFYRVLASLWTLDIKETVSMHSGKKEKILKILHFFRIHHLYKQDTIYRRLDKMYGKYVFGESKFAGMLASSKLEKEIVPFDWYGSGGLLKFRELDVTVPQKYDLYLRKLFGDDYATVEPPVSERTKSHISGVNREK